MPTIKSRIRALVLSDDDLRQWAPVALQDSSAEVEVLATAVGAAASEVCDGGVTVASLRPLMFVVKNTNSKLDRPLRISLRERATQRVIATIDCQFAAKVCTGKGSDLLQYHPTSVRFRIPITRLWLSAGYQKFSSWRRMRTKDPYNFEMRGMELRSLQVFYIRPRPVVLTSVAAAGLENIFPMDLIGPVSEDQFTLALRSTSPAVELMRHSRKVLLADVPADKKNIAYQLGAHHRRRSIDWSALPFSTAQSPCFQLRFPTFASRIREFSIDDVFEVGSHNLFVCSLVHHERRSDAPQLHHTAGFYQAFRRRCGAAFSEAAL